MLLILDLLMYAFVLINSLGVIFGREVNIDLITVVYLLFTNLLLTVYFYGYRFIYKESKRKYSFYFMFLLPSVVSLFFLVLRLLDIELDFGIKLVMQ